MKHCSFICFPYVYSMLVLHQPHYVRRDTRPARRRMDMLLQHNSRSICRSIVLTLSALQTNIDTLQIVYIQMRWLMMIYTVRHFDFGF